MTLEQLKKLIALSNNNPNEHEANSAARRVCKLLGDGEFQITEVRKIPPPQSPYPPWSYTPTQQYEKGESPFNDIWEYINRQKEANKKYEEEMNRRRKTYQQYHDAAYGPFSYRKPKDRPSKVRVCTKCGAHIETFRVDGPDDKWVCFACKIKE